MSDQQEYYMSEVKSLIERISSEEVDVNLRNNFIKLLDLWSEMPNFLKPALKNQLNSYHVIPLLISSLNTGLLNLSSDWKISVELVEFISQILHIIEDQDGINLVLAAVDSSFLLTMNFIGIYEELPEIEEGIQLILKVINNILECYPFIIKEVLQSQRFLQILLTDIPTVVLSIFFIIQHTFQHNLEDFFKINEGSLLCILDEIVYKLSFSNDQRITRSAILILLTLLESKPDMIAVVNQRFQGLPYLLDKWKHVLEAKKLSRLLKRSLHPSKEIHQAATIIQAFWRGYCVRKYVKDLKSVATKIQQHYRMRKQKKVTGYPKEHIQTNNYVKELKLQQAYRQVKEKRLHLLEILPAEQYHQYLNYLENYAATVIQKTWRGYYSRIKNSRGILKREKAAYTIQKWFRRCLQHEKQKKHKKELWKKIKITDEKWKMLQCEIEIWQKNNKIRLGNRQEEEARHNVAQELLFQYYLMEFTYREQENHQQLMLAELEYDADMLLGAPSLEHVTSKEIPLCRSTSQENYCQAKLLHKNELKMLEESWRKIFSVGEND